jgi:DNA repair protein RecN (Recombination protein N)
VLCITHLPQIAALADHQYYIQKFNENGRTYTRVSYLDDAGRADELARLTAGEHRSETILESARELLREAETEKALLRGKKR